MASAQDEATVREHLFETIEDLDDAVEAVGAPVGDVIDTLLNDTSYGLGHICATIQALHAHGEIYQPSDRTIQRTDYQKQAVADGGTQELPDDAEHHPGGFTSGEGHMLRDGRVADPTPSIEDMCVDCSTEALNLRCGCCGMPICSRHHEVQGGFCSRYFETPWSACVWPGDVYVVTMPDHEVLQTPGETGVFHVPADPGNEDCTVPLCREAEDGKERVQMRDVDGDAELCEHCEQEIRAAAEGGDEA